MAIFDIFDNKFFCVRYKLPLHILQCLLITTVIGLSVPRLFMKNQPRTRASTIALGMGAKSLIILLYMLLSEHAPAFKRWHSYKANAILCSLEIVFWGAVAFLVFQANLKMCDGVMCALSWVVVGLAVVINISESYAAGIAIKEFRAHRTATKGVPMSSLGSRRGTDEEEMVQPGSARAELETPKQTFSGSTREHDGRGHGRSQSGWQPSETRVPRYSQHQRYSNGGGR